MKPNIDKDERIARSVMGIPMIVVGIVAVVYGSYILGTFILLSGVGFVFINGLMGLCGGYALLGMDKCSVETQPSDDVSDKGGR